MNRLAYLLAGMAIGAVGMAIAKETKEGNCGNGLKAVVQGGHNIVEKVMGAAETIKEDVEDYLAEAKFAHEEKVAEDAEPTEMVAEESVEAPEVSEEVVEEAPAKTTKAKTRTTKK